MDSGTNPAMPRRFLSSRGENPASTSMRERPEQGAEKLLTGVSHTSRRPQLNRAVGILEIARRRQGTDVDPAANVRMTNEPGVTLVAVSEHDRVAEFTTDLAVVADRRRG